MTDDELREMQERVVQLRELQKHRSWPLYEDWLRHHLTLHQRRVLNGHIAEMTDYREEVGFVKGLSLALKAPDDVQGLVEAELERRTVALEG